MLGRPRRRWWRLERPVAAIRLLVLPGCQVGEITDPHVRQMVRIIGEMGVAFEADLNQRRPDS